MRQATGNESNLVFTLDRPRSKQHPTKVICDTDFTTAASILFAQDSFKHPDGRRSRNCSTIVIN